ncbi:MAG: AIR synthase family protein [Anaerolineae bacterium]
MSGSIFATGKLPLDLLARLLSRMSNDDERLLVGPGIGEDAAVIDMGHHYLVAKTDPITFATDQIGWYAVNVNANDVACMGATPRWFLVTVLFPEGKTDELLVEEIFDQLGRACNQLDITIAGGHSEVTYDLDRPIVVGHLLGEVAKEKLVTSAGAQVGDDILLTKGIPIEGTSLIAREKEEDLLGKGYEPEFIAQAKRLLHHPGISVIREALLANSLVKVHAMHDPTEGGLATGLWELAVASEVGILVDEAAVPIIPAGARLCQEYGLDPLGTIASGSLLLVISPGDTKALLTKLSEEGITCSTIGQVVEKGQGLKMKKGGQAVPLPRFTVDEITKIF